MRRMKCIFVLSLVFLFGAGADLAAAHGSRHHHHHHGVMRGIASVAAPIGIGAAFGPAGSIGYQGFKHRHAIKKRLVGHHRN